MRPEGLRELTSHDDLLAATGGSRFVRYDLPRSLAHPAYGLGGAVAVPRRTHTRRTGMLVMGDPDDAARLASWLLADGPLPPPPVNLTVARGAMPGIESLLQAGAGWRVTRAAEWDWMCTTTLPPTMPGERLLVDLAEADEGDIRAVLDEANRDTDARPFETPGQHWVGARDADGRLVACGVVEPGVADQPVLAGITVLPRARGTGLGLAVTAHLTRRAVTSHGVSTLGMYADNDAARGVYRRLGYGDVHPWSSRRLERRP